MTRALRRNKGRQDVELSKPDGVVYLLEDRAKLLAEHLTGMLRGNPAPRIDDGLSGKVVTTCNGLGELGGDPLPPVDRCEGAEKTGRPQVLTGLITEH